MTPSEHKRNTETLLEEESDALCQEVKEIKKDSRLIATNKDFQQLTDNLTNLDCKLFNDFVKSDEFEQVFTEVPDSEARSMAEKTNGSDEPSNHQETVKETQQKDQENPQSEPQKESPGLANPEEVPKMLLVMSLLGFATAARMHILQGRHRTAIFQWVISGITMYLSVKSAQKDLDHNEQMVVPWVFLLNGLMASVGAYGILSDGINKARYWNAKATPDEIKEFIKKNPGFEGEDFSKLNYEKFQIWYNQQITSKKKSVLDQFKLDDSRIVELTEGKKINMDPRHLKILLGGAVTGFGMVSAAFAIRQLVLGTQELRNNFKLTQTDESNTYGEVLSRRVSRIKALKRELSNQAILPAFRLK